MNYCFPRDVPTEQEEKLHAQKFQYWGVHHTRIRNDGSTPTFPSTFQSVAQDAYQAITHTLYNQCPLDPNLFSNSMSRSVNTYRPIRHPARDIGRIGIEIDSARYMTTLGRNYCNGSTRIVSENIIKNAQLEGRALRRFALLLAAKLSQPCWEVEAALFKEESFRNSATSKNIRLSSGRLVAVYFNTMQLTVLASQELQDLKQEERLTKGRPTRNSNGTTESSSLSPTFDTILLCCLGQDGIPEQMIQNKTQSDDTITRRRSSQERRKQLEHGSIDSRNGIVVIVQPTEQGKTPSTFHDSSLEALQRLCVLSTIHGLPVVVISPRLSYESGTGVSATFGGMDSSRYEISSLYGGLEPPRPGPWLLRDFTPPVYAWVGAAKIITPWLLQNAVATTSSSQQQESNCNDPYRFGDIVASKDNTNSNKKGDKTSHFTRIALSYSVMEEGHPWHMFVASTKQYPSTTKKSANKNYGSPINKANERDDSSYTYLASTRPYSGRPDGDIIETVFKQKMS